MSGSCSTPSQTVGPFLHIGLHWDDGSWVVPAGTDEGFWIRGGVLDGAGEPIRDALVETWQADHNGHFDHPDDPRGRAPGWRGFGRSDTRLGEFGIYTVLPGPVPAADGSLQAPHIDVSVFARGMLRRAVTRIYFPQHADAHALDPVLRSVPAPQHCTLISQPCADGYRFDIRLQGPDETVFFDV